MRTKWSRASRPASATWNWREQITEVLLPKETVVEMRGNKEYRIVADVLSRATCWSRSSATKRARYPITCFTRSNRRRKLQAFLGGKQPTPLTQAEVDQIVHNIEVATEKPKPKFTYEVGEVVRIKSGPFASFTGKVEEINEEKTTLKVTVTIFGRSTPVELNFLDVEKVTFAEEE